MQSMQNLKGYEINRKSMEFSKFIIIKKTYDVQKNMETHETAFMY